MKGGKEELLIGALGIRLRVEVDPDQARRVAGRWERRNELQVRTCQPLSAELLERARAIVLTEMARKGWQTRQR